ncbi:COG1355, Predicted dioxygenase [invertebrate metagenome]|uniref:COG1355, Predicted dioxygenase n=1 Tax=invertebrate metagenome TaxID=1711999 RepID=A0A484H7M5_9ZZZZ
MASVRAAVVAGSFYPANPSELTAMIRKYIALARGMANAAVPKALIAPHAGYIYSGPVAARAYARLLPARGRFSRVVLIGPSHLVTFQGFALSSAEAYETPLGRIPIDQAAVEALRTMRGITVRDAVHAQEHSLEVHLPFLQEVIGPFTLVPVITGEAGPEEVAAVLEMTWGGPETLVVVSTDLSHYLDYESCQKLDETTMQAIESCHIHSINHDQACGRVPVRGLLAVARRKGLTVVTLDVRNSGDTAGPRNRVVGYGAWALLEQHTASMVAAEDHSQILLGLHGETLLHVAAASIRHGLYYGRSIPLDLNSFPPALRQPSAAFVTLNRAGQLRGCMGSSQAWHALVEDVADNAFEAAFADPRFRPLLRHELPELEVTVSLLTDPQPMLFHDQGDLLAQVRSGIDGLLFEDQGHQGLLLPQVWEQIPKRSDFLVSLKRKAGLAATYWSPTVRVYRFTACSVKSADLPDPTILWKTSTETA